MSSKKNKNRRKYTMPTTVEIFQGMRSLVAREAIFHTGGGVHANPKDKPARKREWRLEEW